MSKRSPAEEAARAAARLHRKNPKIFYALFIAVIVIAIAVGVTYAVRPDLFRLPETTSGSLSSGNADGGLSGGTAEPGKPAEGKLVVHFIDVGQGDCIYIEFPDGKDMLIDAGSVKETENDFVFADGTPIDGKNKPDRIKNYIKRYNPDDVIDYAMVTHRDKDHWCYMDEVFEAFRIGTAFLPYDSGEIEYSKTYNEALAVIRSEPDCEFIIDDHDFEMRICEDVLFSVYSIEADEYTDKLLKEANEYSPICVMSYAGRKIVFTGDAEDDSEADFVRDAPDMDCDVLKVGHHGSETSSTPEFLNKVKAEYAVISAGNHADFRHPRQVTLDKLRERNTDYYCTRFNGTVVLTIDNEGTISFVCAKGGPNEPLPLDAA